MSLLLGSHCVGCHRVGAGLCPSCGAPLTVPASRHWPRPAPPGLPALWTVAAYHGAPRRALIGYKERGRRDLAAVLGAALAGAVRAAAGAARHRSGPLVLVPVPSDPRTARRRGGDHMRRLARVAAGRLGGGTLVRPVLAPTRALPDQSGLRGAERGAARLGAFGVHSRCPPAELARIARGTTVVVDDLVTSGYTVVEAVRSLRRAGVDVAGVATIMATERRLDRDVQGLCLGHKVD